MGADGAAQRDAPGAGGGAGARTEARARRLAEIFGRAMAEAAPETAETAALLEGMDDGAKVPFWLARRRLYGKPADAVPVKIGGPTAAWFSKGGPGRDRRINAAQRAVGVGGA